MYVISKFIWYDITQLYWWCVWVYHGLPMQYSSGYQYTMVFPSISHILTIQFQYWKITPCWSFSLCLVFVCQGIYCQLPSATPHTTRHAPRSTLATSGTRPWAFAEPHQIQHGATQCKMETSPKALRDSNIRQPSTCFGLQKMAEVLSHNLDGSGPQSRSVHVATLPEAFQWPSSDLPSTHLPAMDVDFGPIRGLSTKRRDFGQFSASSSHWAFPRPRRALDEAEASICQNLSSIAWMNMDE